MAPGVDVEASSGLECALSVTGAEGEQLDTNREERQFLSKEKLGGNVERVADLSGTELPVQAYENAKELPSCLSVNDPALLPLKGICAIGEDDQVPLIDLSPLTTSGTHGAGKVDKVKEDIGRACETWGIFQAVNHGIPESLLDRTLAVGREFFLLPFEEKLKFSLKPGGSEGYGKLDFGIPFPKWSDNLRLVVRPRRTPENDLTPDQPPSYRATMEEYTAEVERLFEVVWTALSEYLGLESDTLQKQQGDAAEMIVRLNYYPRCPEPDKILGLPRHKDFGSLTVLLEDEVGGLQVQKPQTDANTWVNVQPRKGALLINVASMLEMLSNGRLISCVHRAVVNRESPRLSIAHFANPGPKHVIRPIPELLEKTKQRPRYKQLVYGDYLPNIVKDHKAGVPPYARYEINRN